VISLRDVHYRWPRDTRDCLAIPKLDVARGQAVFVHGPSGCGKSTLLGLMAGVLVANAGQVMVAGQDWARLPARQRDALRADKLGVIFQQFNLLPYLSAIDNTLLPCRFSLARRQRAAASAGSAEAAAAALLERVGLAAALWRRPAAELSVGQQQRVAAARALIGAPELVIADEPTSALDAELRDAFMALLLSSVRDSGATLVFVSHDERLAAAFDARLSLPTLNQARAA
jgi:putative ABC transport system ATP-binding protein